MPEHLVIGGAVAYVDADGLERWAQSGDTVDFTNSEAKRLMDMGMLHDEKAAQARAKAEEDALQAARDAEDRARADEAERLAGERAAAQKAQKASATADKSG